MSLVIGVGVLCWVWGLGLGFVCKYECGIAHRDGKEEKRKGGRDGIVGFGCECGCGRTGWRKTWRQGGGRIG